MNKLTPLRTPLRQFSLSHGDWILCKPKPTYGPVEIQRSELLNGTRVSAYRPNGALMGACTILWQAGSRYEENDTYGATHFLRMASAASGQAHSGFSKSRALQQYGAALTCTSDRQNIAFSLRCPVTLFPTLKTYLLDTACRCCYNNWDIDDLKTEVWRSLDRMHPKQRVMDLVQKASWRGPLTNSIFCEPERVDSMKGTTLAKFAQENFKTNNCTVATIGVPFEETIRFAEMIEGRRERPEPRFIRSSFPRRAYEVEDLGPNSTTWIAVAVPGCGTSDPRCLIMHSIIAAACGTGNVQMGEHRMDRTPMSPLGIMAGDDIYTEYKAFNISYKDTGVFGILAKTRACSAWDVTMAASEFLTNVGDLNFDQINIGKQRLKLGVALSDEDCVNVTESLALQLANNIQIDGVCETMGVIDCLTPDEISCVAKNLSAKSCDMALAVVGDAGVVPHEWELIRSRNH